MPSADLRRPDAKPKGREVKRLPPPDDLIGPPTYHQLHQRHPPNARFVALYVEDLIHRHQMKRRVPTLDELGLLVLLKDLGGRWGMVRFGIREIARILPERYGVRKSRNTLAKLLAGLARCGLVAEELRAYKSGRAPDCIERKVFHVIDNPDLIRPAADRARAEDQARRTSLEQDVLRSIASQLRAQDPERFRAIARQTGADLSAAPGTPEWATLLLAVGEAVQRVSA